MAEMAAKAHEISLEAGSRMAGTMREVIGAAAGLTAFAIESARDLVQYMVRRGQMSQDEADKLMREVEAAHATQPKAAPKAEPAKAAPAAKVSPADDVISLAPPVVPRPPKVAAPEPVRAPKVAEKEEKATPAKAAAKVEKAAPPKVETKAPSKPAEKAKAVAVAAAPAADTIDFACSWCDAPVKVSFEMEGKQTPCPACRRVIKVPMRVKQAPKDWRQSSTKLPAGARRDADAAPEGAWGTGPAVSTVSRDALEQAGAIREEREPVSTGTWIKRGCYVALLILVLGGGWLWFRTSSDLRQRDNAVARAVEFTAPREGFGPEAASEINRALGELCWLAREPGDALQQFQKARGTILDYPNATNERELLLLDIALGQAELGGDREQVKERTHLPRADVNTELLRTMEAFRAPEARAEAIRQLADKLMSRRLKAEELSVLWQKAPDTDKPEAMALVGLQRWRAGHADAELAGEGAQKQFDLESKRAAAEGRPPPAAPALVTLWLLLGKPDRAEALKPAGGDERAQFAFAQGTVEAQALQGQLEGLRTWVKTLPGPDQLRYAALIATAALQKQAPEAADLEAVAALLEGPLKDQPLSEPQPTGKPDPSWLLWRLVRVAAQAGHDAAARKVADAIPDPALRGRAQLEVLRAQLAKTTSRVDEARAAEVSPDLPAHGLAREAIARHNARAGGMALATVDAWTPDFVKPFGYAGIALGIQDKGP